MERKGSIVKKAQSKGRICFCETDEITHPTFGAAVGEELSEEVAV